MYHIGLAQRTNILKVIFDGLMVNNFHTQVRAEVTSTSIHDDFIKKNSLTEWFTGWEEHGNYNRQPNDDGLSEQDCVEIRRYYHRPSTNGISVSISSLTESFMWNDRDCATRNFFLCERLLIDGMKKKN